MNEHVNAMTLSERADEIEEKMMHDLAERIATKSVLFGMADGKIEMMNGFEFKKNNPDKYFLMGADPRLPKMPAKPTLIDFFKNRFASLNHLLQSAALALKNGHNEKIVLACLLHDIGVASFIRCDHGYWGAQMIEPYVDEEVSWAVRMHQALRFFPDTSVGYEYPQMYINNFGADYKPEPYIVRDYERAKNHKWYMSARLICVNDIYSFDPNAKVNLDDFVDIIGRNFKQPEEGLGFDNSPSSHMWRTLMWPTRYSVMALFPSPLWGGVRGGGLRGNARTSTPVVSSRPLSPPLPHKGEGSNMKLAADQPSGLTALDRPNSYIGRSVPRPNLHRLTAGRGQYVSDVVLPRMVHVAFLRSPHAHAGIKTHRHRRGEESARRCCCGHRCRACHGDHAVGRGAHASQGHQIGAAARYRGRARLLAG